MEKHGLDRLFANETGSWAFEATNLPKIHEALVDHHVRTGPNGQYLAFLSQGLSPEPDVSSISDVQMKACWKLMVLILEDHKGIVTLWPIVQSSQFP